MAIEDLSRPLCLRVMPTLARSFLAVLARLDHGELNFTAPDGTRSCFRGTHAGPQADLEISDWGVAGAIMLFELALWFRKTTWFRTCRCLGSAQSWMKAHIWLGLLTVPCWAQEAGGQSIKDKLRSTLPP